MAIPIEPFRSRIATIRHPMVLIKQVLPAAYFNSWA